MPLYSRSDRTPPVETFGKSYRNNPSWMSNDRILAFGGFLHQVNHDQPGGGNESDVHWFDDHEMFDPPTDLGDGELARGGDPLAAIRGYGDSTHWEVPRFDLGSSCQGKGHRTARNEIVAGKGFAEATVDWTVRLRRVR